MRTAFPCFFLSFLLPLAASDAIPLSVGVWTSIGPMPAADGSTGYSEVTAGRVTAIAADPTDANTIYLGAAAGGVWKSTDAGITWTAMSDTQPSLVIGALAVAPSNSQVIYAGTGEANNGPSKETREHRYNIYSGRGVLKSTDGGESWTLLGENIFTRRTISKIVVSPNDENVVYAAVGAKASDGLSGNTGVWKSEDGGGTWTNTTARISTTVPVSDIIIDPTNARNLYAAFGAPLGAASNNVYRSTDAGATWNAVTLGGTQSRYGRIALAVAASSPRTVFAVVSQASETSNSLYGMYKSNNGGTTWSRLPISVNDKYCPEFGVVSNILAVSGDYHIAVAVDPSNAANVYLAGLCVIGSADGGSSWSLLGDGASSGPHRDHHALAFDASGLLLNGNDGGIWRLDDAVNASWTNLNASLSITQFQGLAVDPGNPNRAVGGTQDTGTMVFSGDVQWSRTVRGDGGVTLIDPTRPARVYQVLEEDSELFARSLNGGDDFTLKRTVVPDEDTETRLWYFPMVLDPNDGARLLIGTYRLWYSTDAGVNWKAVTNPNQAGWTSSDPISAIAFAPSSPKMVYASAGGHVFFTSDITAATPAWTLRDLPSAEPISAIVVDPRDSNVLCLSRNTYSTGQVFCSTDGGRHWKNASGDLPTAPVLSMAMRFTTAPSSMFVGTQAGVFASTDGGDTWTAPGEVLPNTVVPVLSVQGSVLTAGTHGRGAWQMLLE